MFEKKHLKEYLKAVDEEINQKKTIEEAHKWELTTKILLETGEQLLEKTENEFNKEIINKVITALRTLLDHELDDKHWRSTIYNLRKILKQGLKYI